jgi:hypothetical protein
LLLRSHHLALHAEGFASLGNDFFDSNEERTFLESLTGHILAKGCVLMLVFVMFNFLIAVLFLAYAEIKGGHVAAMLEEEQHLSSLRVCFPSCLVCLTGAGHAHTARLSAAFRCFGCCW